MELPLFYTIALYTQFILIFIFLIINILLIISGTKNNNPHIKAIGLIGCVFFLVNTFSFLKVLSIYIFPLSNTQVFTLFRYVDFFSGILLLPPMFFSTFLLATYFASIGYFSKYVIPTENVKTYKIVSYSTVSLILLITLVLFYTHINYINFTWIIFSTALIIAIIISAFLYRSTSKIYNDVKSYQ